MCAASAILTTLGTFRFLFRDDEFTPSPSAPASSNGNDDGEPDGGPEPESNEPTINLTTGPPTAGPPYTCRQKPPHLGMTEEATVTTDEKGNYERRYQYCSGCRKSRRKDFLGFCDRRGILPENPDCSCGLRMRQAVAVYRVDHLRLVYQCTNAVKDCGSRPKRKENGEMIILTRPQIEQMRDDGEI